MERVYDEISFTWIQMWACFVSVVLIRLLSNMSYCEEKLLHFTKLQPKPSDEAPIELNYHAQSPVSPDITSATP